MTSMLRATWILAFVCCIGSCTPTDTRTPITFWHFWSEPAQRAALRTVIDSFERANPTLRVELTELSWSDGRSKLQLAFNAGTAPDVVHLGAEWIAGFADAGVLSPIASTENDMAPNGLSFKGIGAAVWNDTLWAMPWTLTTRLLFLSTLAVDDDGTTLEEKARHRHDPAHGTYGFGVSANETHNVFKRIVPFLWAAGSRAFRTTPYSASIDSSAVRGLEGYLKLAKYGVQEPSRQLDERFLRGEVAIWMTGSWIADGMRKRRVTRKQFVPLQINLGPSLDAHQIRAPLLLSGDYLAISAKSGHRRESIKLIAFIGEHSAWFCGLVPDAGVPAYIKQLNDLTRSMTDRWDPYAMFALSIRDMESASVAPSPVFLDAEALAERRFMEAIYGTSSAQAAVDALRADLVQLENTR
jgi:ABC-type glycerol-3-phosphate transport system substrate-binding protein